MFHGARKMELRHLYDDVYSLETKDGIVAYKNKNGISYCKQTKEAKDIELFAEQNSLQLNNFNLLEFFAIGCCVFSKITT